VTDPTGRWSRRLGDGPRAVLHPGVGERWWWAGGPVVDTGPHVWWLRPDRALCAAFTGVTQVVREDAAALSLWSAHQHGRLMESGTEIHPLGARVVPGPHPVEQEDGFVYRWNDGRWTCAAAGSPRGAWTVGPRGALLGGVGAWRVGAAPGRAPQALPEALLPLPVRWSDDGDRVAGETDDGGVELDLRAHQVVRRFRGHPVTHDAHRTDAGAVLRGKESMAVGIVEASCAQFGCLLAGPGGLVWDLRTGTPVSDHRHVVLGVTVGSPEGFYTVDWETLQVTLVGMHGGVRQRWTLPCEHDDTPVGGAWVDGAAFVKTALGAGFRMTPDGPQPADAMPPLPRPADRATVDGVTFHWTQDGWLFAYSPCS